MALLYFAIAVGLFVYTIVLLSSYVFLGSLVSLILVVVALALAYREHFWFTQMKHRRLGLKFQDWLDYTFRGKK